MPDPSTASRNRRRSATVVIAALAVVVGAAIVYWRVHSFNVRAVLPGEVYRVAQPDDGDLEQAATSSGFRTIVNLRGPNPGSAWYRRELDMANRLQLELVSLRFETFDWPPRIETLALVEALDRAQRPILMHCHSGLDRSGWAAGVVRLLHGDGLEEARGELSRFKGHFCDRKTCALHRFFDRYEEWLAETHQSDSPRAFREWLQSAYYPPPYAARITPRGEVVHVASPGAPVTFGVTVENFSGLDWHASADKRQGIRLGARILGPFDPPPADPVDLFRQPRTPALDVFRDGLSTGVWPTGEKKTIEVGFDAPREPGLYFVQVDMVDEMVHWFSDLGDGGLVCALRVERQTQN